MSERHPPPPELPEDDDEANLRDYAIEDIVVFFLFWFLAAVVFAQFFTRYVLRDPLGWTEEGARFLLIYITFLGGALAVRKNSHIFVEVLYHFVPDMVRRVLMAIVDVLRTVFFAACTYYSWIILPVMDAQRMSVMPFPMSYIYGVVFVGFLLMTVRSLQVTWRHVRARYAKADDPGATL